MNCRKATVNDTEWVYEVLSDLRGDVPVSYPDFKKHFEEILANESVNCLIFEMAGDKIGYVTLNSTAMPRYIGKCVEIEEFVVHPLHRRRGYGLKMLELIISDQGKDKRVRKLIVKSNGQDSIALYEKLMNKTDLVTLQLYLNKL